MSKALNNIVVVGGDLHAWTAAAGLLASLSGQNVTITVVDDAAPSLPGVVALDISAHAFHRRLGVQEPYLVSHVGGAYSYGVRYHGFGAGSTPFTYTHSPVGEMINRVHFHHYLSRLRLLGGEEVYEDYSIASLAARDSRFTHPQPGTALERLDYTMQVDRLRYQHLLQSSATEHGVEQIKAHVSGASFNPESGQLDKLKLSDGAELPCDFIVDCKGELNGAKNREALQDWREVIPFDRKLSWVRESISETPTISQCHRLEQGCLRTSALPGGEFNEFFYDSSRLDGEQALSAVEQQFGTIQLELSGVSELTPGVHLEPWHKNVLALGRACGNAGNLLFGELAHTHTAIERWLALYPSTDIRANTLLAGEYNKRTRTEYEHVRDAHALLLATDGAKLPSNLAHRIGVFRNTGRVAFYESDVLSNQQWVNLLIGCGVWPDRADPMLNQFSKQDLGKLLAGLAKEYGELAAKFPKHDQLLQAIRQSTQ